jgi:hypothetical protein
LNSAKDVTGYIVQLPLPFGIDTNEMLELIDPDKDADGLHPINLGRLVLGVSGELTSPLPCTPAGIVELLSRYDVPMKGAEVAIIGRGVTVGRPLGLLMTRKGIDSTVTLLHEVGITVNRNSVPNDPRPAMVTSGVRIGTPALATRGFGAAEFAEVAEIIAGVLVPNPDIAALRARTTKLTEAFPLYSGLETW